MKSRIWLKCESSNRELQTGSTNQAQDVYTALMDLTAL